MDTKQALEKLFSQKTVTLSDGRDVAINRVSVRTLGPALALLAKVVEDLKLDITKGIDTTAFDGDPAGVLKLISKHYEELVTVAASLTDLTLDDAQKLGADDGVLLIQAVYLVNQDFFTKNVLPALGLVAASREVNNTAS